MAIFREVTLLQTEQVSFLQQLSIIHIGIKIHILLYKCQTTHKPLCILKVQRKCCLKIDKLIEYLSVFPMKIIMTITSQSKAHFSSPADNKWRDFLYFIVQIFIFEKVFPDGCSILIADRP